LLLLSGWDRKSAFHDPFCGSGTLCIEAAMLASNTAPGLTRSFAFEVFPSTDGESFVALREVVESEKTEVTIPVYGSDIDDGVLTIARENTAIAGFADTIVYLKQDVMALERLSGYCVTNPPYGKRVLSDYTFIELYSHVFSLIVQVG
jgi:putative N6-adenine-specific DNA methylase